MAMCPTRGEGNGRRWVTRTRVYVVFLLPERQVRKITVSAKGKTIYMQRKAARKTQQAAIEPNMTQYHTLALMTQACDFCLAYCIYITIHKAYHKKSI